MRQKVSVILYHSHSVIHLTKTQVFHENTKYIDVIHHFVCDVITFVSILVGKVIVAKNPRDMMIKPIFFLKFKH